MNDSPQLARVFLPVDGGPIYQETPLELSHWLVEPWNAISSLFIILPGIYFLFKLRGQYRDHLLLTICVPLLILGGTGSTLFHAFRNERFFLLMDWMPTAILFLLISGYLWYRVLGNAWGAVGIVVGLFVASGLIFSLLQPPLSINLSYGVRGVVFLLPLVLILIRTYYRYAAIIAGAVLFFGLALLFRYLDKDFPNQVPMGTHFLWHTCTGLGGLLVAEYVYRLDGLRWESLKSHSARLDQRAG